MLIILEGCDATGKTTLANMLAPLLNAQIVHSTAETPNTYGYFEELVRASEHTNIIADRFCYSQFVYQDSEHRPLNPELYPKNNSTGFSTSVKTGGKLYDLETEMLRNNTKVIYCYADAGVIAERMIVRGEDPIAIDEILCGYRDLWKKTLIQPIWYKT